MVCGPSRQVSSCSVSLDGNRSPSGTHLQVPRRRSDAVTTLVRSRQSSHRSRHWVVCTNHNLFAQRRSPSLFRSSLIVHVRAPEQNVWIGVCRRERHLLRWPAGTPNASVPRELGLLVSSRMPHALSWFDSLGALDSGSRTPLFAAVFRLATRVPAVFSQQVSKSRAQRCRWIEAKLK